MTPRVNRGAFARLTMRLQSRIAYGYARRTLLWLLCIPVPTVGQIVDSDVFPYEVNLSQVLELGSEHGPVFLPPAPFVVRSGDALVVAPSYDQKVAVFNARGELTHTLGGPGQGPGEFPAHIVTMKAGPDGTVYVVHGSQVTRLDAGAREISRQFRLPIPPIEVVPFGAIRLLAIPAVTTLLRLGPHVSIYDEIGALERTVALPVPGIQSGGDSDDLYAVLRVVAPSGDSAIWASSVNRYAFDLVALDGTVLRNVEPEAPWFPQDHGYNPRAPWEERPLPRIFSVREDANGLLWVLIRVAAQNWTPNPLTGPVEPGNVDLSQVFDTMLEIVDPIAGVVLARHRFEGIAAFLDGGPGMGIWSASTLDFGIPSFEMWAVDLARVTP